MARSPSFRGCSPQGPFGGGGGVGGRGGLGFRGYHRDPFGVGIILPVMGLTRSLLLALRPPTPSPLPPFKGPYECSV